MVWDTTRPFRLVATTREARRGVLYVLAAALSAALIGPDRAAAQNPGCENPQAFCGRFLPAECLDRIGAGAIASDATGSCAADLANYSGCLELVSRGCDPASAASGAPTRADGAEGAVETATIGPLEVGLLGCSAASGGVTCSFRIRNTGAEDKTVYVYGAYRDEQYTSRAFGAEGDEYRPATATLGSSNCSGECYFDKVVPSDVPFRGALAFSSEAAKEQSFRLLDLAISLNSQVLRARFRDVPITR